MRIHDDEVSPLICLSKSRETVLSHRMLGITQNQERLIKEDLFTLRRMNSMLQVLLTVAGIPLKSSKLQVFTFHGHTVYLRDIRVNFFF